MKKLLIVLLLASSPAFAQVPNKLDVVKDVARRNPVAFSCAHTVSACGHDFIKILACTLWKQDPRFGLNGKRGNPSDLSWDAINWKGSGPGHDPTNGNTPVTVIDVIGSAGSPAAYAAWTVFDTLPGPGAWVQPVCPDGTTPEPTPTPVPPVVVKPVYPGYPGDDVFDAIAHALFADYETAGQAPNAGMGRWFGRTVYDWLVGNTKTLDESIIKHRAEWLDLLPKPQPQK